MVVMVLIFISRVAAAQTEDWQIHIIQGMVDWQADEVQVYCSGRLHMETPIFVESHAGIITNGVYSAFVRDCLPGDIVTFTIDGWPTEGYVVWEADRTTNFNLEYKKMKPPVYLPVVRAGK